MSKSIIDFFKESKENKEKSSTLPHNFVQSAVKEIKKVEEQEEKVGSKRSSKRGTYSVVLAENKAKIAR